MDKVDNVIIDLMTWKIIFNEEENTFQLLIEFKHFLS